MSSGSFAPLVPLIFVSENYHIWVVKMKMYLQAYDLWEVVETNRKPAPLRANLTIAQIRQHNDESAKKYKELSCLQNGVLDVIFTRIMACETPKQAWGKLKERFQGTNNTRQQQLLNLKRDFENLKMKETEMIKRIVEKVITSLTKKYESKISSLEDSRDLTTISLSELINALYALAQKRASREDRHTEGAFQARNKESLCTSSNKDKKKWNEKNKEKRDGEKKKYPPCSHCKKSGFSEIFCWFRPGVQCKNCKQFGHVEKVCKNKVQQQQQHTNQALAANENQA
ncbi:uncharacterized protein LOC108462495 [Gossypium arboreum]|uniref:uncharacterized protein LOC108462495 n=1 Tax=Gossypium arboreum TaxID=29729 RepID=UPI000818F785|nr:uncharacterized protein LOC108462495 [Gossypium arboreum]